MVKQNLLFLCSCLWIYSRISSAQNVVNFKITEEAPSGKEVGNIKTESKLNVTSDVSSSLRYNFLESNSYTPLFRIDNRTGILYTNTVINREQVCDSPICVLSFDVAVRSVKTDLFQIITVKITVEDINDNAPTFKKAVLDLPISESAANNSKYPLPVAVDDDTSQNFSIQSYEISPPSDTFGLIVNKRFDGSFSVDLVLKKKLNREVKDHYQILVVAKDGGSPPQVGQLTINIPVEDANDNSPVFSQNVYNVSVNETTKVNSSIVQITATDADSGENGRVTYQFSPHQTDKSTINRLFYINNTTGYIYLLQKLVYVPGKFYEIFVDATDHGERPNNAQAKVILHVEDAGNNKPVVKINLLSAGTDGVQISEAANVDAFVAHVNVEDSDIGDNGKVSCDINQDTSYNYFKVESLKNGKGFKVVIKQKLDYEGIKTLNVTVVCHDFGSPPLSASKSFVVHVTDDNDNKPVFVKNLYLANIDEKNKIGDQIIQVSATDRDSGVNKQIQYFLQSDAGSRFAINSISGVITARAIYDREVRESYKFHVIAVDKGDPPQTGTTAVVVAIGDKNDNKPVFNQTIFTFEVMENSKEQDTYVGRVWAHDRDKGVNSEISYSIAPEDKFLVPFVVFPEGIIRTNRELDRESQSQYNFVVYASDKGNPSLNSTTYVTVYVTDDNDNDPIIIFPNKRNNTISSSVTSLPITTIQAYDVDEGINKRLNYYIQEGNGDKLFIINVQSGEIFLNPAYRITKDMSAKLVICVKDSGNPVRSKCTQLNALITINNATSLSHLNPDSPNKYITISIVVVIVTILVSVAIILTIFFLRKMDRNRQKQKFQNGGPLGVPTIPNGFDPAQSCSSYAESETNSTGELMDKKKKEVSFSPSTNFEDVGKNSFKEINLHLNPTSNENSYLYDKAPGPSNQNSSVDTVQLQHFQDAPPSYHMLNHGDNHSDMSGETTSNDSGRGGSENEVPNSSQSTEDRSFEYPSQSYSSLHNSSFPSSSSYHGSPRKDKSYSSQKSHLNRTVPSTNSFTSDKRHSSHSFTANQRQPFNQPHRSSVQNFSDNYAKNVRLNTWGFMQQQDPSRYSSINKERDYFHLRPDSLNTLRSREDDDDAATTTSGSYTLDHEEINEDLYPSQQKDLVV